jgi:hypothetical protein
MAEKWHSGITMHKLTVGPGIMGLLFALGCALIFVIGLPALWTFVAFSAALGLSIALLLHVISRHRSERAKPLSILQSTESVNSDRVQKHQGPKRILQTEPLSA